jgi:hypothetical protein
MAASMSPPVSVSAFLHSIMPSPVRSRMSLTNAAEMFMSDTSSAGARRSMMADTGAKKEGTSPSFG